MVRDYVTWMRLHKGWSEHTVRRRRRILGIFFTLHPDPTLVTSRDIEQWLMDLRVGARTRSAYLSDVASFYKWATRRGLLAENPAVNVEGPKLGRGVPKPIPQADLEAALADAPELVERAILLGWLAGLRCMEITALRGEHVYDGIIHVMDGKGHVQRDIPMHPRLGWLEDIEGRVVPVTNNWLSWIVGEHFRSHEMPWTLHKARHSFGTAFYRSSKDLLLTRDLMGHQSVATTQIYAAADLSKAAAIIASFGGDDLAIRRQRRSA